MKKTLIIGYFVSMILLTFFVTIVTATYHSDKVEVKFRNTKRYLSDTEVSQRQLIKENGKCVVDYINTKETRTKKFLGWETKIDTLNIETLNVKD